MLIDSGDFSINVLVLLMHQEKQATLRTLEALLDNVERGVTVSVLLNGGTDPEFRTILSSQPAIRYYESPRNLGVAGGRNFLLSTEECGRSDMVMFLDNDVIPPTDYVRGLASFLVRRGNAGVVGAVVAAADKASWLSDMKPGPQPGVFGRPLIRLTSEAIRSNTTRRMSSRDFFHIGMHPDYRAAYFSLRTELLAPACRLTDSLCIPGPAHHILRRNSRYRRLLAGGAGSYEVSTVAGCSQAFRRSLIDRIGPLDERFNPYGLEDADFCIRAIKAGFHNYIDTNTWLLHGTDGRTADRNETAALENNFRCLAILASSSFVELREARKAILRLAYCGAALDFMHFRPDALRRLKARLRGLAQGEKAVGKGACTVP